VPGDVLVFDAVSVVHGLNSVIETPQIPNIPSWVSSKYRYGLQLRFQHPGAHTHTHTHTSEASRRLRSVCQQRVVQLHCPRYKFSKVLYREFFMVNVLRALTFESFW